VKAANAAKPAKPSKAAKARTARAAEAATGLATTEPDSELLPGGPPPTMAPDPEEPPTA
jgi:hypothetical protein